MSQPSAPEKRRIFLGTDAESFHIFSMTQNKNEGSIYFSAPAFKDIVWRAPSTDANQQLELLSYQADDQTKLSLHGSGQTHLPKGRPDAFAIQGNRLWDNGGDWLGTRHLVTIFLTEPRHRPSSPALAKKSDYVMTTPHLRPCVLVLWAIPVRRITAVTIKSSFKLDEIEDVPPIEGWGTFEMRLHSIVWLAYRTKFMDQWPLQSQACYDDGYLIPLFIGTGAGQFRLDYHKPSYVLVDDKLTLTL
ncbi:hypothetical protein ACLK1G_04890 [Pseudomonas sp. NR3]|uniref:hypothetical protein n=1 Tax=Pseudomonas sp. NR3 TaxID=3155978 RepID=UPI003B66B154